MPTPLPESVISHVSLGTNDYYAAFVRDLDGHKIEAMLLVA